MNNQTKDTNSTDTFVSPGIGAVLQTFFFFKVFIIELLPTLG